MKVTMVGISGSGKTTFMSALYSMMGGENDINGFSIVPTGSSMEESVFLTGQFSALDLAARNFKFPPGTSKTTLWSFDLLHCGEFVCNFEWIDYRGGVLGDISNTQEDLETIPEKGKLVELLNNHIAVSNAVVLFADAFQLAYYDADIKTSRRVTGATIINELFINYNQHHPRSPLVVVIALTKVDELDELGEAAEKWKENNYKHLIEKGEQVFQPLITIGKRNRSWSIGIVPVSAIGDGNANNKVKRPTKIQEKVSVEAEIINEPKPINASHALLFCLGEILFKMKVLSEQYIKYYEKEIELAKQNANFIDSLYSMITNQQSQEEKIEILSDERASEFHNLKKYDKYIKYLLDLAQQKVKKIC